MIATFARIVEKEVEEFFSASQQLGEPLIQMAEMVREAFHKEMDFIGRCIVIEKPDDTALNNLQEPVIALLRRIQAFRDQKRHDALFANHLATIAESVVALSWITVPSAPAQFIKDMKEAGDYFGNRVLNANKSDPRHMLWINKWQTTLNLLEMYVKRYHLTGFAWNSAGGSRSGARPHPPPPPPPVLFERRASGDRPDTDNRQALMREINQGVAITERLRPVVRIPTREPVAVRPALPVTRSSVAQPVAQRTYPPKFALEGRKWRVEYYKNDHGMELHPNHHSESLAMFKCEDVILANRAKINGVTIDNCKRSVIYLSDIIASVDLIRCERVQLQCMGIVPLISLDSCDSIQIGLSESALGAEIIHSKSTTLNVCLLQDDGDYTELPLPEQIRSVVINGRLQSRVVDNM